MTLSTHNETRPTRIELGRALRDNGSLTADWEDAFAAVDRAVFLPDVMWPFDMETGTSIRVDKARDPQGWFAHADSDDPIITQWDDGHHDGTGLGKLSTSSSSAPTVVFSMLRDLQVLPGQRVLEIGTGTGWNAGLLAYRLGDEAVTTIEVDEAVAESARKALEAARLHPTVVCGDGMLGHPEGALYDRLIATCGLRQVPGAWVKQVRPGGLIVAPWGTHFSNRDVVVRLAVAEDGRSASGRFLRLVEFMKARAQRLAWPRFEEYLPDGFPSNAAVTSTRLSPFTVIPGGGSGAAPFAVGLAVLGCVHTVQRGDDEALVWFISLTDRSWAAVRWSAEGDQGDVYQSGSRRLWGEVEAAWRWWDGLGRPGVDRFGLTVHADGRHETWFEEPGNPLLGAGDTLPRLCAGRETRRPGA